MNDKNTYSVDKYLKIIAEKEGITKEEVQQEIGRAVSIALKSPDPQMQRFWTDFPCENETPTIEEIPVRLFANIAPFPPITDAFEQSISTSFTIALSGKLLKLNVMVLEFPVTPGNNATDIAFDDVTVFDDVVAAKAVT